MDNCQVLVDTAAEYQDRYAAQAHVAKQQEATLAALIAACKEATGLETDNPESLVAGVQALANALRDDNRLDKLCREYGIRDEADMLLLSALPDLASQRALAERLAGR
ncbi:hypothetical protein [Nostocoides veronense]